MLLLVAGLVIFIGAHVAAAQRGLRQRLIDRIGAGPYKLAFSLVSALGLVLIVYGYGSYRANAWVDVWSPPRWTRHITALLMWFSIVALFAAYLPGRIKRALKHPMLVAVKTWALAHLIANGDLGSIVLFGSLLAYAVYARISLKRRGDAGYSGSVHGWGNDVAAVVVGTLAYLALGFTFHPLFIGVPAFG